MTEGTDPARIAEVRDALVAAGGIDAAIPLLHQCAARTDVAALVALVEASAGLGDSKSLICHPATTTHQRLSVEEKRQLGIEDGVVRLSVGLEDPDDLIEDLTRTLDTL